MEITKTALLDYGTRAGLLHCKMIAEFKGKAFTSDNCACFERMAYHEAKILGLTIDKIIIKPPVSEGPVYQPPSFEIIMEPYQEKAHLCTIAFECNFNFKP